MTSRRKTACIAFAIILPALLVFLVGCSSLVSDVKRITATGIEPGEAIAIVPKFMADNDDAFESSLALCIKNAMNDMGMTSRVLFHKEFRRAVFGDLKQAERPVCDDITKIAMVDSQVKSLLEPLGVRYLVCVSGFNSCTRPRLEGGGIPMAYIEWDKRSRAEADIYDLKSLSHAGSLFTHAKDSGAIGIFPPFFIPAMTEAKTCKRFGREIAQFLASKDQPISEPNGDLAPLAPEPKE